MAREGTKTARAIAAMVEHKDKPMEEVLPFIAEATGHDLAHARNYYVWCVRKKVAPGVIPERKASNKPVTLATKKEPKPTVAKPAKVSAKEATVKRVAAEVVSKAKKPVAGKKPAKAAKKEAPSEEPSRNPEDLAAIKSANLARLKAAHARRVEKYGEGRVAQFVVPNDSVESRSLEEINEELDSFAPPKFLMKDHLKSLV